MSSSSIRKHAGTGAASDQPAVPRAFVRRASANFGVLDRKRQRNHTVDEFSP
jgi:hypothetical protein